MITVQQLTSGAEVYIEEIPHVRSAALGVYVKLGSRYETQEVNGVAHFIEHMLFKGTPKRKAREIAEAFEAMGGQLNAYTSKEYTCIYTRVLDESIYEAMEILFDMLFNSSFAEKDLKVEQGVILEEINMYEDSPDELVHDVFAQTIFAGHSLGWPIIGRSEVITGISFDEIREYYRDYYRPDNMVIAVAGNVKSEEIIKRLEIYCQKPERPKPVNGQSPPSFNQGIKTVAKDTEQVQICLGVPGISYLDERRHTQNMMNSILGGGMSSRLFQRIREEKGLAYSVYSYPSTYSDVGSFAVYVGTSPANIKEFFATLKDELDRFLAEGVTWEELRRTQNQTKSSIYLGLESIMTRMNRLGKSALFYGRFIPVEEVMEKIMAVTPEMVREYAVSILGRGPYALSCIGPKEVLPLVEEEFRRLWWEN